MKYVVLVDVTDYGDGEGEFSQMLTVTVEADDTIAAAGLARDQAIGSLTAGIEGPTGPFTAYTTVLTAEDYAKATGR
jgi:hypothetical protein